MMKFMRFTGILDKEITLIMIEIGKRYYICIRKTFIFLIFR